MTKACQERESAREGERDEAAARIGADEDGRGEGGVAATASSASGGCAQWATSTLDDAAAAQLTAFDK